MRPIISNRLLLRCTLFATATFAFVVLGDACKPGGNEGDACNPLVLREEENCNAGLTCKPASCSASYCCPKDRTSSDPNCNGEGCPDPDAGADAVSDAAEPRAESGSDAAADAASDADPDAAGDSG